MNDPAERDLADELAARFRIDIEQARDDLVDAPAVKPRNRTSSSSAWLVGIGFVGVIAVAIVGGSFGGRGEVPTGSNPVPATLPVAVAWTPKPTTPSLSPTPAPAAIVQLVDGLPIDLDGMPVLRGQAAVEAILKSGPGDQMLVGGWLAEARPMSCPGMPVGMWWNPCLSIQLHETAFNGPMTPMYLGPHPLTPPVVSAGETAPIVLSVHTHDSSCPADGDCSTLPVVDEIVWFGGFVPLPTSFGSPPPSGMSRDRAITVARGYAAEQTSAAVVLASAMSAPYGEIQPEGSEVPADRWVWAIVFAGRFSSAGCDTAGCEAPTILVILDYVSGDLIIEEAPA